MGDRQNAPGLPPLPGPANGFDLPGDIESPRISRSHVMVLRGHDAAVHKCVWSPVSDILASGGDDSTARLWNLNARGLPHEHMILRHRIVEGGVAQRAATNITDLNWNNDGNLLATSAGDGLLRIWGLDGQLVNTFNGHTDAVVSALWSRNCEYILSASNDTSTVVWNVLTGDVVQRFTSHIEEVFSVDWKDDITFASSTLNPTIHVSRIGVHQPIKIFTGHTDEVYDIKWDPQGNLLASASGDATVKIWSLNEVRNNGLVRDLRDHEYDVQKVSWSPTGPQTPNPNLDLRLASASFDHTVRLWEMERGTCVHTLRRHTASVSCICFSPDGRFIASGGHDKYMHIWSAQTGVLIHSYQCSEHIYHIDWNSRGDRLCISPTDSSVIVVDLRRI